MSKQRLYEIIKKILAGNATAEEIAEISNAIQQDHVRQMVEDIHYMVNQPENEKFLYDEEKWEALSEKILESDEIVEEKRVGNKIVRLLKRVLAASAILAALALGIYFIVIKSNRHISVKNPEVPVWNDIAAPVETNAVLTLSNKTEIELGHVQAGLVSQETSANLVKLANGELVYRPATGDRQQGVVYHTLTVPKGSKLINVTLADGTKVWLNNESSLRYPTAFTGEERKVEITGEAYFEVAKDAGKPFFVLSGETTIKVMGTHFNVNAYSGQPLLKVTVVEGTVHVIKAAAAIALQQGQQAQVNERIKLVTNCDLDEVIAWKNERFAFHGADIQTGIDQLARWYDLDVMFTGKITKEFRVEMTRNCNASNVFKTLEGTGGMQFKFENNKIYVMQ